VLTRAARVRTGCAAGTATPAAVTAPRAGPDNGGMSSQFRLGLGCAVCALVLAAAPQARADPARFDLAGPTVEMTVSRGSATLPAAEVPNLVAGDRVWMKADLPPEQSAHYILVAAFLRGSTNPPPKRWFSRCDTWTEACAGHGMTLTVPAGAGQLLVFFAPETGGDFKTLVNTVRGRPGVFVRTSQDLNEATLERARLERYLAAVRTLNETDPGRLKEASPLLARSLAMKLDEKCLQKIPQLQAACLTEGRESLILDDGHSTSMTQALTSGAASDLAMEASNTSLLRYGYFGPYIGSVFDIARLFDSFHTAQYQYIPALAFPQGRRLALVLNAPPSFHDPKSVLVAALPAVAAPEFPPLRPVDAAQSYCARRNPLVLPVDGAPLVFSTDYARDLRLRVTDADGRRIELPAHADAERGGFVVDTTTLAGAKLPDAVHAALHGYWGFDAYQGPTFQLVGAGAPDWRLVPGDEDALVVGREDIAHLRAGNLSCLEEITLEAPGGRIHKLAWQSGKTGEVEVRVPLQDAAPGELMLLVRQYGVATPQRLTLHAFAEAAHLDSFVLHAGDHDAVLRGDRLDEVQSLSLEGIEFLPGALASSGGKDELAMSAGDARAAQALRPGDTAQAKVALRDGRTFNLKVTVEAPRPRATLIARSVLPRAAADAPNIQLESSEDLPQQSQLTFSLRAAIPRTFTPDEQVEVATADGSASTVLEAATGGLTFVNSRVAVATLDPSRALGPAAFGPLRYRVVDAGVAGDWQPLGTLVRLPVLRHLECPPTPATACKLSGSNLYLLASISADEHFSDRVLVPDGFPGQELVVPRPSGSQLYLKLRDDPAAIEVAHLEVQTPAPPPSESPQLEPAAGSDHVPASQPPAPLPHTPPGATAPAKTPSAPGTSPAAVPSGPATSSSAPSSTPQPAIPAASGIPQP
jgi:hypothetical protein